MSEPENIRVPKTPAQTPDIFPQHSGLRTLQDATTTTSRHACAAALTCPAPFWLLAALPRVDTSSMT
jgi:hypothetical protein